MRTKTFDGIKLTARRELVERTRRDRSFLISTLVTLAILIAIIFVPKLLGSDDPTEFEVGLVGAEVHAEGAVGAVANAADRLLELRRGHGHRGQDPEAAGRGGGRGQCRARHPPHARLHDRGLDPEALADAGAKALVWHDGTLGMERRMDLGQGDCSSRPTGR